MLSVPIRGDACVWVGSGSLLKTGWHLRVDMENGISVSALASPRVQDGERKLKDLAEHILLDQEPKLVTESEEGKK